MNIRTELPTLSMGQSIFTFLFLKFESTLVQTTLYSAVFDATKTKATATGFGVF